MIAIDTNILARFYVNDPTDPEADRQGILAKKLITQSPQIFVPLTVILELEWVLRAFYGFTPADFVRVVQHLLGLPQAKVAQGALVLDALQSHTQGLDFADALHLHASSHCTEFISFDDKKFARRAMRLGLTPHVTVPI